MTHLSEQNETACSQHPRIAEGWRLRGGRLVRPKAARGPRKPSATKQSRAAKIAWLASVVADPDRSGCRDWPWATSAKGYGQVSVDGILRKVGHLVMEADGRPRPPGLMQTHSCDRPICAAPWHLRWGTAAENNEEIDARGRRVIAQGEDNGHAKLTVSDVLAIRSSGLTNVALAEEFGVHKTVIGKIRRRVIWRSV